LLLRILIFAGRLLERGERLEEIDETNSDRAMEAAYV
jgi:hypothetical protein